MVYHDSTRLNGSDVKAQAGFLLLLAPVSKPAWLDELVQQMAETGYHIYTADDTREVPVIMKTLPPDAVIATREADAHQAFSEIKPLTESFAPLRILVTETLPDQLDMSSIDVILPPHAPAIHFQIVTYLRQRESVYALQQEIDTLKHEIEHQKMLVRELQHASDEVNLLKNAIVRNVSHELKTPLLHVKSAVAMLAEDVGNTSKLTTYATEAVARLESIVNNITRLAYSIEINMEPVMISEVVDQAVRNLRRSWQHKDAVVRIQVNLEKNIPPVHGDKQGLGTVLQLLLDNALKFSEGAVEVSAFRIGSKDIEITVRDYGIGIPPNQLDKIFDSFYQIDNSSTRRYGGTGTGLAIVKLILDRHQVMIKVESSEGKGSSFSFRLPTADIQGEW